MRFNARLKSLFFDRPGVMRRMSDGTRAALSKFGSFVRTRARSLIQPRKRASFPGAPPSSHTGILKKFIFFVYEPQRKNVVIGPALLNQIAFRGPSFRTAVRGGIPEILEHGGIESIFENQLSDGRWVRADLRSRRRIAQRPQRWRTIEIAARPFMRPAHADVQKQLPQLWRDAVHRAA